MCSFISHFPLLAIDGLESSHLATRNTIECIEVGSGDIVSTIECIAVVVILCPLLNVLT